MDWLFTFPEFFKLNTTAIDTTVRSFAVNAETFLDLIKGGLNSFVSLVLLCLRHVPWPLFLLLVALLVWRARRSLRSGVLYAALVAAIGFAGLWQMMLVTLSVVLASVMIALVIGIPIGILISGSDLANKMLRPVLDTMQTMPVFVYLIPALLLFGTGNASGVIATVIYAVVPVIRLTSLGIRQVDKEVVEAARAFGSTRWQTLFKVQIPQAKPTIMAVTTSMIGVRGLGMEVLNAVNRIEIGRGLVAGSCVVVLAIVLDRVTQGMSSGKGADSPNGDGGQAHDSPSK